MPVARPTAWKRIDMGLLLNVITIHNTGQHMFSDILEAAGFKRHQNDDLPEDGLFYAMWPYVTDRYQTLDNFRQTVRRAWLEIRRGHLGPPPRRYLPFAGRAGKRNTGRQGTQPAIPA
jgi:hypothetical protein